MSQTAALEGNLELLHILEELGIPCVSTTLLIMNVQRVCCPQLPIKRWRRLPALCAPPPDWDSESQIVYASIAEFQCMPFKVDPYGFGASVPAPPLLDDSPLPPIDAPPPLSTRRSTRTLPLCSGSTSIATMVSGGASNTVGVMYGRPWKGALLARMRELDSDWDVCNQGTSVPISLCLSRLGLCELSRQRHDHADLLMP